MNKFYAKSIKMKNYKILENRPELTKEQVMLGMNFNSIQAKVSNPSLISAHKVFPFKTVVFSALTALFIISGTFIYNKNARTKKAFVGIGFGSSAKASGFDSRVTNTLKTPETKTEAPKQSENIDKHVKQVQPEDKEKKKAKEEAFIKSIEESLKLIESYRQRVLQGESMSDLAIKYSQDPGSAKNGGRYDDIDPNQLVPEFRDVAVSLKLNEVSTVFKTQYGFHFMQLIETKGRLISFRHILIIPKVPSE